MPTLKTLNAALIAAMQARDAADAEVQRLQAEISAAEDAASRTAMEKRLATLPPDVVEALRGEPSATLAKRGFVHNRDWRGYEWTRRGRLAREILGVAT